MGGTTPNLAIPYPVGTDRVADGDNAMEALARRVENRMPWGYIAYAYVDANYGCSNTYIPGLTVNWTAVANRRYRITCKVDLANTNSVIIAMELRDGGSKIAGAQMVVTNPNNAETLTLIHHYVPAAGAKTHALYAAQSGGGTNVSAHWQNPSYILIEDMGSTQP